MAEGKISIIPEQATAAIGLLTEGHDQAGNVRGHLAAHGIGIGAANDFRVALDAYVTDLKEAAKAIQGDLQRMQQGVTDTIVDLGERDATLAQQATTFLAGVEAIESPPASAPPSPPTSVLG